MTKSRKKTILTCLDCGKVVCGGKHLSHHIQKEHGYKKYEEYKIKYGIIKSQEQLLKEGAVKCEICGLIAHDLTSHITRTHKITTQEYKNKYKHNIRSDDYIQDQSNRIMGDKNPAYNHGGKYSPFSDKFIYSDKIDKEELIKKVSESSKNNGNNNTTIKYWIKKGFTENEAKEKISERQSTFTLQKCIKKYGEEDGIKIWVDRQEKWKNSCKKTKCNGFSKISQELFWKIYNNLNQKDCIFFAQLDENKNPDHSGINNEYRLKTSHRMLLPDFININLKKIIEFDGTYWHNKYKITNTNRLRDSDRDEILIKSGYDVLHIKEEDYKNDPDECLIRCLDFLNE